MGRLGLNTFLTGTGDLETKQYHVLQGLKECYNDFSHSRLYPALAELVEVHTTLEGILQKKTDIQNQLPHQLREVDIERKRVVYEPVQGKNSDLERTSDLISWALPKIQQAIDEGVSIYHFVDDHISIAHVGIMPMYREEGYWFVPDLRASLLHLFRYEVSLYTSATERYRTLKTSIVDSIEQKHIRLSPESIKLELIEKYHELPNPATYICETDLDFPYTETILPIAKRKLLAAVFS